jgi:alkylated DNA nucleotide flippase Atl1
MDGGKSALVAIYCMDVIRDLAIGQITSFENAAKLVGKSTSFVAFSKLLDRYPEGIIVPNNVQ